MDRIEGDGRWIEAASDPKEAIQLLEKHAPDLQKRGEEDFQRKYMRDLSEGFEKVSDPNGNMTFVRRDRMEQALAQGYGMVGAAESFVVPEMPWHKDRVSKPGRSVYRYDSDSGSVIEVS